MGGVTTVRILIMAIPLTSPAVNLLATTGIAVGVKAESIMLSTCPTVVSTLMPTRIVEQVATHKPQTRLLVAVPVTIAARTTVTAVATPPVVIGLGCAAELPNLSVNIKCGAVFGWIKKIVMV